MSWLPNSASINSNWWLSGLSPISWQLRAAFYLGLLLLCAVDYPSPLHAARIISETNRVFYTPARPLQWIGVRWVAPPTLRAIVVATIVVWVAAALGLCVPVTATLTFLGFAFLHAVNWGALGSNHSTHAALYVLFFMCFAFPYNCSTSNALSPRLHWPQLLHKSSVLGSGFAPRMILISLVYCMFAAGVAKLRYGGLGWLNGSALRFYVAESAEYSRWPAFTRLLLDHPWLCRMLSWFTVAVELSSIAILYNQTLRVPMIILWCVLHVGILFVMMPAYWIQMWCYLLLIDWDRVLGTKAARYEVSGTVDESILTALGVIFSMILAWVLLAEVENWPFTNVPMYSNAADAERAYSLQELRSRAREAIFGNVNAWKRPWVTGEAWEDIWIQCSDGASRPIFDILSHEPTAKWVRWSQFAKVVRRVAIEDMVSKPASCIVFDEECTEYPATCFLRRVTESIRDDLPGKDLDLRFVCRSSDGWIVLGRTTHRDLPKG